jgi:K+-sensing histidine kinase KdpD
MDLLRLARIESATEAFTMAEHDLGTVVHSCLERRRTLAESRRQTLHTVSPPEGQGPAIIWADEEALEQILDNLIDNALKYTPEEGAVEVRWGRHNAEVVLEVRSGVLTVPEGAILAMPNLVQVIAVRAQGAREAQEAQGHIQRQGVRLHAFEQAGALWFLLAAFILGISALSIWGGNQQWCDGLKRRVRAVAGFEFRNSR